MYKDFNFLKDFIAYGDINIDNWVFRLHRQLTFIMLLGFSVFVSTNQFFGDPIDCFTTTKDELPGDILDNYCWIQSTFSMPGTQNKVVGVDIIYPGIDTRTDPAYSNSVKYHSYYQWVCFFLFFEAILFYLPYYAWKIIDDGKIRRLLEVSKLSESISAGTNAAREDLNNKVGTYYRSTMGLSNTLYAYKFVLCECTNFANVVAQIYIANAFLGGEFTTFGIDIIKFSQTDQINRTDPMIALFPRVTKCEMQKVGVGGNIQHHDALCVLPYNMFNEKIFIFLWFWFVILSVVSGTYLLYRISLFVPIIRFTDMRLECFNEKKLMKDLKCVLNEGNYGDWFVLDLLHKNVNGVHFGVLVEEIKRQIDIENAKKKQDALQDVEDGGSEKQPLNYKFQ